MRRRLISLGVLVLVLAAVLATTAQTVTPQALTALAAYFPEDAPIFAVIRTDPDYPAQIDHVIAALGSRLPGVIPPELSAQAVLELLAQQAFGGSFEDTLGYWLGDTVAFGLNSLDPVSGTPDFLIAIDVDDRAGAEQALGQIPGSSYASIDVGPYTVWSSQTSSGAILVGDQVALIGIQAGSLTSAFDRQAEGQPALATHAAFETVVSGLPGDSYNIFAYIDTPAIQTWLITALDQSMGAGSVQSLLNPGAYGAAGIGLTTLDNRTLVMDTVISHGASGPVASAEAPIDPGFAAFIPHDAQLVIHDNNLSGQVTALVEAINTLGPALQQTLALQSTEPPPIDLSAINFGGLTQTGLTALIAGLTGLNLEDDILSWMTGDHAAYARLIPLDSSPGVTLDLAVLAEATNPDAALALVEAAGSSAEIYDLAHFDETYPGGGTAEVLGFPVRAVLTVLGLGSYNDQPAFDTLVAANTEIFAIGTRPGVEFALTRGGDSLLENETYVYAQTLLIPDAQMMAYIGVDSIIDALDALPRQIIGPAQAQQIARVLGVVESLTISASVSDQSSLTRFTVTIEDEALSSDLPSDMPSDMALPPAAMEVVTEEAMAAETEAAEMTEEPAATVEAMISTATPTATATAIIAPTLPPTWTPTPTATSQAAAPSSTIVIDVVASAGNVTAESVTLRNTGPAIDLAGWALVDSQGNIYIFPAVNVFTNGTIFLFTRAGTDAGPVLFWGRTEAVYEPGETITLLNPSGVVQATYTVP